MKFQEWREGTCRVHLQWKGHQSEGWGCHSTVKNSDPESFLSKGTVGTKMEKRLRERRSSDQHVLWPKSRRSSKVWHYYWCSGVLTDRSLAWLPFKRPNKQLTETDTDTPNKNVLTTVVEWGRGWKKLRKRVTPKEDQQSQLTWPPRSLRHWPTNWQHTRSGSRTLTHIQQRTSWSCLSERILA